MSPDPNTPDDEESGGGWFPLILAVIISVIALILVVPNSARHASSMDEPTFRGHENCASASAAAPANP